MSTTRELMAELRRRLGTDAPLAPPPAPTPIAAPSARGFSPPSAPAAAPGSPLPAPGSATSLPASPATRPERVRPADRSPSSAFAAEAARHTTALVGIGHVGTRYATDVVLQFQAELAVAHGAVAEVLPEAWPGEHDLLPLQSRVGDHREFLLRPDLGRRLDEASLERLRASARSGVDVQPILADGLSAVACMGSGPALLEHVTRACEARGLSVGTPMCARFARVWLEDEIGQTVGARVAMILLGERPGLGTGDGLSAYLVHEPRVGKTDGDRNMMSNIHARGTPPAEAAPKLALLAATMIEQGTSGVGLELSPLRAELGDVASRTHQAPRPRERLVHRPTSDTGGAPP